MSDAPGQTLPEVEVYPHAVPAGFDASLLTAPAGRVVGVCAGSPGPHPSALSDLVVVEVNLVDDATIAAVHGDFLGDPSPTDVITFPHGEVFISLETAVRAAPDAGHSPEREAMLYLVHAVLHLHGHCDADAAERATMGRYQERILDQLWPPG